MKVLIIGGVAGGASAAARLRRIDENIEIILFERGPNISFANCGLPYHIGEVIKHRENLLVQTAEGMEQRFRVDVRVNNEVINIDPKNKQVEVMDLKKNKKYTESYDKLILSPGAAPFKPDIAGIKAKNVFTLRNLDDTFRIKELVDNSKPKHAVVVGGGFIGLEIAENLHERGVNVTIVELANQILAPLDYEMAVLLQDYLREKGIKLQLGDGLKEIQHKEDASIVELNSGTSIETNMIVLGIGVRPEIDLAKKADLTIGERGGIKVNKNLQTSDPDIYAVGDVIEVKDFINGNQTLIPLAGPANKQGRIAANNILGIKDEYKGTQGTSVLKLFDMTTASTGNNEKILKRFNIPYLKSYTHSISHAGYYPGAMPMAIKLLFSPENGTILGAQAVGFIGVEKRIDVLATAIRAKMTVLDLQELELSYAPPYSSAKDPVNMAGYVASNILNNSSKVIHWDEFQDLSNDSFILDVRTKEETKEGMIKGALNIPIDELRERIEEIPKDKEIIIYCAIGLRGYLAHRILVQNGYSSKNLSGGYTTYEPLV
ncbi:NADPH-dependent 2,4-dienoyl-CoA reductase, sulfur reductase [Desulfonispora thiosulfatigenes DSM 11270]|uniref:NADPH-dependent 2,4-dienoyl-CoA reductase, sulfur reductase n=1 Tax=Desulfonispora thiosulfatigenes DSM 11270 TaxID=656914 RepID=A0A1W1UM83_DESTI|nr:NADPH-dependent 2,4-dienoyl-CoA reductase, sulfur reductase [Desulfonispora thiosulfatigenes DSM 11270]